MHIDDKKKKLLVEVMNSDEFRSEIIANAAVLDMYLGTGLTMYFSNDDVNRSSALQDQIIDRLSFSRKIEILSSLPLKRKYKSLECISKIRRINRIRNHVAHTHCTQHFDKIFKDSDAISLILDYPDVYRNFFTKTRVQLMRLLSTEEFAGIEENKK